MIVLKYCQFFSYLKSGFVKNILKFLTCLTAVEENRNSSIPLTTIFYISNLGDCKYLYLLLQVSAGSIFSWETPSATGNICQSLNIRFLVSFFLFFFNQPFFMPIQITTFLLKSHLLSTNPERSLKDTLTFVHTLQVSTEVSDSAQSLVAGTHGHTGKIWGCCHYQDGEALSSLCFIQLQGPVYHKQGYYGALRWGEAPLT